MDQTFVCSECEDGDVVVDVDFADTFICKSCDTRFDITNIGNGNLDVKKS